jgi:Nif-specific regulatory protein
VLEGVIVVFTYVTSLNGPRAGSNFVLEDGADNPIGRGTDCHIVLSDPLCSRVHAKFVYRDGGWWLLDAESRNGTFVNHQKVDEAQLSEGCRIRLGSSEFSFHQSEQQPTSVAVPNPNLSQTHLSGTPDSDDSSAGLSTISFLTDSGNAQDFLVLYQLCLQLLSSAGPDEVVDTSLGVLREITGAAVAGFVWVSDDGQVKVRHAHPPEAAGKIVVDDSLTTLVYGRSRAIWMNAVDGRHKPAVLARFADAICVPMLRHTPTPAAVHLYKERGRFEERDFLFTKSLAAIMAAALVRAQQQAALQAEHRRLVDKSAAFDELIGECPAMRSLKEKTVRVARATGCLLIRGESGVGKELVARAVHRLGARADRPLLSVNCAAIPRDIMESQLFGHKRGAFTGADADHAGLFEQADTGTLLLDEVGELTLEGQAKLLRILDGYPFLPVGGSRERSVDVRVIAATNRDLREFVREKRFREDLYYRLTVFELYIPPLRERGADIARLIEHFLEHFKRTHGRPQLHLSDAARQVLLSYNWPGNVRQLRNVLDSAVVLAEGDAIQPGDLGLRDLREGELDTLRIEDWERRLIREALSRTRDSVPEAAKLLGIGRATLYRKLEEYGIVRGR